MDHFRDFFRGFFHDRSIMPNFDVKDQQGNHPQTFSYSKTFIYRKDGNNKWEEIYSSSSDSNNKNELSNQQEQDQFNESNDIWNSNDFSHSGTIGTTGSSNLFIFGELFSAVEEMFGEVERSMGHMDGFFGNGFFNNRALMPLPSPEQNKEQGLGSLNDNLRSDVLKKDTPNISGNEKVDLNLDELYKKSSLDFNDMPIAVADGPIDGIGGSPKEPWKPLHLIEQFFRPRM